MTAQATQQVSEGARHHQCVWGSGRFPVGGAGGGSLQRPQTVINSAAHHPQSTHLTPGSILRCGNSLSNGLEMGNDLVFLGTSRGWGWLDPGALRSPEGSGSFQKVSWPPAGTAESRSGGTLPEPGTQRQTEAGACLGQEEKQCLEGGPGGVALLQRRAGGSTQNLVLLEKEMTMISTLNKEELVKNKGQTPDCLHT